MSGIPAPSHPLLADPVQQRRISIVLATTLLALGINITGLWYGITTVLPHLLYFPILIAGYWYPRRGPACALFIAAVYCSSALLIIPQDLMMTASIIVRGAVLVIIGVIVSLLAVRLRRSERQLHDLIEFLPDATFAIDRDGTVIAWNRAIEELTGIPKKKMLGRAEYSYAVPLYGEAVPILTDFILQETDELDDRYHSITRTGTVIEAEVIAPCLRGGKGAHLKIAATPLFDSGKEIIGAVESIRDITAEVITRSALENSNRQLNALSGIIRHGLAERLDELYHHLTIGSMQFDDPAVLAFVEKIETAADSIRRQLAISRDFREIGSKPPLWLPVQDRITGAADRLDTGGMNICSWTERLVVFADPHFSTAVSHLIENAHAAGAAALLVTYRVQDDGCEIIFEDNGPGIPGEEKEKLFSEGIERPGHGLFLAQEILAITGITIHEEGISGLGARFVLHVPPEGYTIT